MRIDKRDNSKRKKKKIRSKPIIVLGSFYSVLFAALIIYICNYAYSNRQVLLNNSYNTRQQILLDQNLRGQIVSRNGDVLAYSEVDANGKDARVYPYGKEFAHVVGYSTNGKAGIEALANYYLINTSIDLPDKVALDTQGSKYPGDTCITTLDVNLQEVAYNALSARKGAVVVSNPKTGEILAMVSKPDFDPNTVAYDWDKYLADTSPDAVLLNRATQGMYAPGSTFKIVTALEYIKEHPDDYDKYSFTCNGRFKKDDINISCYHGSVHGGVDLYKSFAKSCNSSFANIGVGLDRKKYSKTIDDLGFNKNLPIDINYSVSKLAVDEDTSDYDMAQISIGQGKAGISPMHLNMITNAIANGGSVYKPMLVDHISDAEGKIIKQYDPEEYCRMMSEEEADVLTQLMIGVVENGTGTRLKSDYYQAAGKTGSA